MNRLCTVLILCLFAVLGAASGQQTERVEVSGTLDLPPGAMLPPQFRVELEILKLEAGSVINLARRVGQLQTTTVKIFPYQFKVACPKSVLKDTPTKQFIVRGLVYELPKSGGSKLIFQTPDNEKIAAFTANGEPRQDIRVVLKAAPAK